MPGSNDIVIQRYLERLHHSARRGGLLYAFPTKSVKRLDLTRLRVADASLPSDAISRLIRSEGGKLQIDLNISQQEFEEEVDEQSAKLTHYPALAGGPAKNAQQALYYALTSGLARTAEAFKRETGVRSLWLAYPLFYARVEDERGKFTNILSPIFLWPIIDFIFESRVLFGAASNAALRSPESFKRTVVAD